MRRVRHWLRRTTGITIAVVTAVIALALTLWAYKPTSAPPTPALQLETLAPGLRVHAGSVTVGNATEVEVTGNAPDGTPVRLDVQTALMTARMERPLRDGSAVFSLAPELLIDSGTLVLRASTAELVGTTSVEIAPDKPVNGVVPLAGPRSIVADTKHWTMVSVIPGDQFGNGMPDGTPVRLHVRRPDGRTDIVDGTMKGLLDGIRVWSGTVSGLTTIRVEIGGATGPEIQVREVAGPPVQFALELAPGPDVADGRSLVEIRTPRLADQYNNTVEDGTAVEVRGVAPDGPFRLATTTIDGRAIVRLRSAADAGQVSLQAEVAGTMSTPLEFDLAPDVVTFETTAVRRGTDVTLSVGPVLSSLGGFAPDGTPVLVEVDGVATPPLQLRDGMVKTVIQPRRGQTIRVKVLGKSADATAP